MEKKAIDGQIAFILEADRLKTVTRNTLLTDRSRFENSAEHSWHAALTALILFDGVFAKEMDLSRVLKMLLVHDLVEIDAGDLLCYDMDRLRRQKEREAKAAERIFGLLPGDQRRMLQQLWQEFEAMQTPESMFANAMDRFQPLLQAIRTRGQTWLQHGVNKRQILRRMEPIRTALPWLWDHVLEMIENAAEAGYLVP